MIKKSIVLRIVMFIVLGWFGRYQILHAQQISGTVTDQANDESLPGVNIVIKGTTQGTSTDADGTYNLNVSSLQDTLVFSFIGYQTRQVPINGRTTINIRLQSQTISGEDLVVVGYGTVEKTDLTGSVGTVDSDNLTERDNTNVTEALQGKVAGVSVHSNSGAPGRTPTIRIRGINSINAGLDPLYVVDGVTGVDPSLIDPNNIESMEVLKDASATAIYGARGSNGVILITTKRGVKNNTEVSYKSNVAYRRLYRHVGTLTSTEFMDVYNRAFDNAQKYDPQGYASGQYERVEPEDLPRLFDENGNPRYNTNWEDVVYAPTWSNNQYLSVRGGSDKTTYSVSGGYTNENGIMAYSNYKRYDGKFTLDTQAKSWLQFGGSLTVTKDNEHVVDGSNGALNVPRMVVEGLSLLPIKYPDGSWGSNADFPGMEGGENPLNIAKNRYTNENALEMRGDVYTTIQLLESLEFKSTFSTILANNKNNFYSSKNLRHLSSPEGNASVSENNRYYWQSESYFTWQPTLGEDHSLKALFGFSWLQNQEEDLNVSASGFLDDFFQWENLGASNIISKSDVDGGVHNEYAMNSYFARFNYSYKNRYLLTVTGRYDGSSVFGENNKYAFFPSIGFAWRISEEPFMESAENISNLKLRLSAGSTGNQNIGSYNSLRFLGTSDVLFAGGTETALTQSSFGNPDLKWETTDQYDVGIELGLFEDRIQLEADAYYKKTRDLLFDRPIPWSTGLGAVTQNIGDLENRGLEIGLTTRNITGRNLNWTTSLNWSANRSKVLKLGQDNEDIYPGPWFLGNTTILRVGEPIGSLVGYTRLGTWGTDEAAEAASYNLLPGDLKWADLNNDGTINEDDSKIIGRAYPLWTGNISNTFNYKNFDLSFDIRIVYGSDIYNATNHSGEDRQTIANSYDDVLNAWTPDHQNTDIAQVRAWGTPYQTHPDTHWLEDGSFIRGQNLMLGYSLPQDLLQKVKVRKLRFYLSVQNWFLITKFSGYDPEATTFGGQLTQNIEFFQYPKPRIYRLGFNLTF